MMLAQFELRKIQSIHLIWSSSVSFRENRKREGLRIKHRRRRIELLVCRRSFCLRPALSACQLRAALSSSRRLASHTKQFPEFPFRAVRLKSSARQQRTRAKSSREQGGKLNGHLLDQQRRPQKETESLSRKRNGCCSKLLLRRRRPRRLLDRRRCRRNSSRPLRTLAISRMRRTKSRRRFSTSNCWLVSVSVSATASIS